MPDFISPAIEYLENQSIAADRMSTISMAKRDSRCLDTEKQGLTGSKGKQKCSLCISGINIDSVIFITKSLLLVCYYQNRWTFINL